MIKNLLAGRQAARHGCNYGRVYGNQHLGIAPISSRVADLKYGKWKKKVKCRILGWHDKENPALYWYQIEQSLPPRVQIINDLPPFKPKEIQRSNLL